MDFKEIEWNGVDGGYLTQDRDCWHAVVNMVENLLPENVGNFSTTYATISCSRWVALCEGNIDPNICESCFRFYDPSVIYVRLLTDV
jgi:hypothetical protein